MSSDSHPARQGTPEPDRLMEPRLRKLAELRAQGRAYPNHFKPDHTARELHECFGDLDQADLDRVEGAFSVAGRMMSRRVMGKIAFAHLQDRTGRIQILVRKSEVGAEAFDEFKQLDIGDILGATGRIIRTRTGELSVYATSFELLTKSLRPLPEKWHGLTDREARYRQRYVDLIVNPDSRDVFLERTKIISGIRSFLDSHGFVEVETPVLQPIYGGAAARPFTTHHNALDQTLFLRIATELYLKRLVVGGFERVYEIGKDFRNEGLDTQHSPEFTMVEFYWAYATYQDLMGFTEELFSTLAREVTGSERVVYQGKEIDFTPPWPRLTIEDAVVRYAGVPREMTRDREALAEFARSRGIEVAEHMGFGKLLMELVDVFVEPELVQPTFLTDFPLEVSPLSRLKDSDPDLVDRFELYVAGREVANGFSELNDPEDQRSRFQAQVEARAKGDAEAHGMDHDYVRALEYGMPPTAGEGIGIDRLVMLLTDQPAIRDVILFPLLKPREEP